VHIKRRCEQIRVQFNSVEILNQSIPFDSTLRKEQQGRNTKTYTTYHGMRFKNCPKQQSSNSGLVAMQKRIKSARLPYNGSFFVHVHVQTQEQQRVLVNVIPVRRCLLEEGILNRKDAMLTSNLIQSIIFYKRPFNASTRCSNSKYSPTFIVLPRTTHDPRSIREHQKSEPTHNNESIHWHINYQIMMEPSLTTLIGDKIRGDHKWSAFVDGGDGFFYGIPYCARRVVKFNPLDKSLTEIGPDLGEGGMKWACGVRANTGDIYCAPFNADRILKINTTQGTVETLDNVELPETGYGLWASGALAADNNIYYMPDNARRIMRLNPDNDTLSSVGDDLGGGVYKYWGTVVGNDDCLYGIPHSAKRVVKYNPANPDTTSTVGEEARRRFECENGVLGGDGYIYAANYVGQVLQIDTTNGNYTWIGDPICSGGGNGWGDPIVGVDKCIYWPPLSANRVLKFDPETQELPWLVGGDLGEGLVKWLGGALATDGVIYCIPSHSTRVLAIDPFKELTMTMQNSIQQYPQELGRLFLKDEGCDETFYNSAVRKFGIEKVFKFLVEEYLPSDKEWADTRSENLPLFMIAASCESCTVSVIYHLLRRNVHDALPGNDDGVSKKRKRGST
jgi:hypothetical protein